MRRHGSRPLKDPNDYRLGYSDDEIRRLEDQHRLWREENRQLLHRAGFVAGATVVDIGCGPGFTTFDLARLVGPEGRVIALDRDDERSLPLLRERARAAGLANVEARRADLEAFDLPDGSVDGVYGRWVLMYLPEPSARALTRRIASWLAPGGACAFAEFRDQRRARLDPPSSHMVAINDAFVTALEQNRGCNPQAGEPLPGWLTEVGLRVEEHVVTKTVRPETPGWGVAGAFYRHHLPTLVDEGYLHGDDLEAFFADWDDRSRRADASYAYPPVMEAVGRRADG